MGTRIRIDSVMRPRSSRRGRNTSASVTVTVTVTASAESVKFKASLESYSVQSSSRRLPIVPHYRLRTLARPAFSAYVYRLKQHFKTF